PLRRNKQLKQIAVRPSGIECVFDYGTPPYIPADVVIDTLERILPLAKLIQGVSSPDEAAESSRGL
ncbi:MAG: hypothetical protein MK135_14650, partial [Polyangiaceae bacterium]|nr:hypothetical protein [Polyangiaceae bacterium]